MEDMRAEQKEALQALTEYSPKLLKGMKNVVQELRGNRQTDTDEYLLSIVKGMNWELQILNGTMDYLNEKEEMINKASANDLLQSFNDAYTSKDDEKMAGLFDNEVYLFFAKLEEAAKSKC